MNHKMLRYQIHKRKAREPDEDSRDTNAGSTHENRNDHLRHDNSGHKGNIANQSGDRRKIWKSRMRKLQKARRLAEQSAEAAEKVQPVMGEQTENGTDADVSEKVVTEGIHTSGKLISTVSSHVWQHGSVKKDAEQDPLERARAKQRKRKQKDRTDTGEGTGYDAYASFHDYERSSSFNGSNGENTPHRSRSDRFRRTGYDRTKKILNGRAAEYNAEKQAAAAGEKYAARKLTASAKSIPEKNQLYRKALRKRRQRQYFKSYQRGQLAKGIRAASGGADAIGKLIRKKAEEIVKRNITWIAGMFAFLAVLASLVSGISAGGSIFQQAASTAIASCYLSKPEDIDRAELVFSEKEMNLQNRIDHIETEFPSYDEYRYNIGEIGHDPIMLTSYLSAISPGFRYEEIADRMNQLFDATYHLLFDTIVETRSYTDSEGNEEEYEVYILEVTLRTTPMYQSVQALLDEKQKGLYETYQQTKGGLQQLDSPLDLYWYSLVSSYYGYRKNEHTGNRERHMGLDIAVPMGTSVYAVCDGTITDYGNNSTYGRYLVLQDEKGRTVTFAHLQSVNVNHGQTVKKGDMIGTTGTMETSAGSGLHLELQYGGEYYNPLYYFASGTKSLYGDQAGSGTSGYDGEVIPPDSYDDATVRVLMEEANRYLGMPYTFGGTPPSSFDCSGFVCWVFSNSGVYHLPRTTAQEIYNQCIRIQPSEAKPGDLIFFTKTYNAGRPVTHVGIYCGNGTMVHCGSPISYTSINTSYWNNHFYAYGRLIR